MPSRSAITSPPPATGAMQPGSDGTAQLSTAPWRGSSAPDLPRLDVDPVQPALLRMPERRLAQLVGLGDHGFP